jgi:formylglycine-generating enzyme required for sulfatase activity
VWRVTDPAVVKKIQKGKATLADLSGSTQLGVGGDDYAPCTDNGQNCANDIYAVSLPGVTPSADITWFQAQEACANAGKRLPTSAEWQVGANGTPDPCNTDTGSPSLTGSHGSCISARGAFDMVGNVAEWVADWVPLSTDCPGWDTFSDDLMCLAGASTTRSGPGALIRGGQPFGGPISGPLAVVGSVEPFRSEDFVGFRCAR